MELELRILLLFFHSARCMGHADGNLASLVPSDFLRNPMGRVPAIRLQRASFRGPVTHVCRWHSFIRGDGFQVDEGEALPKGGASGDHGVPRRAGLYLSM